MMGEERMYIRIKTQTLYPSHSEFNRTKVILDMYVVHFKVQITLFHWLPMEETNEIHMKAYYCILNQYIKRSLHVVLLTFKNQLIIAGTFFWISTCRWYENINVIIILIITLCQNPLYDYITICNNVMRCKKSF